MPALSSTTAPLEIRATEAFRAYFAQVAGLTGVTWHRHDDPRDRPLPCAVVQVSNLKQEWAGADEFSGVLTVMFESGRNADQDANDVTSEDSDRLANQAAHHAIAALITNALADQEPMRAFMNFGAVARPVTDFHLYGLFEHSEPGTENTGGCWNLVLHRRVVCARVDYE